MRLRTLLLIPFAVLAGAVACADRRESVARESLTEHVRSQSNGALMLGNMMKTNGFVHQRDGMKLYTIEWQATLQVHADGWKAGWRDYSVLSAQPNAFAAAVEGLSVRRLLKGGAVQLKGKSELQDADQGWRVVESEVTAFQISPPPEVAGFLGTWHIPEANAFFRIDNDDSRGLLYSTILVDRGAVVSRGNVWAARLSENALVIEFAEGSGTITKVSDNELIYTEEDAFNKWSQKALRVRGGDEQVVALARRLSTNTAIATRAPDASGADSSAAPQTAEPAQRQARVPSSATYDRAFIGRWKLPDDLAFLSERDVGAAELAGLSKAELRRLRNFIYARHGRAFASDDMRDFFERQPWYRANSRYSDSMLSAVERANIGAIAKLEKSLP
ncbi:MAG: YARHG domain-containing protein [Thermoanaerobaculia bacterium]